MVNASFLAGLNEIHYTVMNKIISAGKQPGLLSETVLLELTGDTLYVSQHQVLFPCGLFCETDAAYKVKLSDYGLVKTSSKSAWTVCWEVDSNLVSSPQIVLKQGLTPQAAQTNFQAIIGWIVYAGSNTDVETSLVIPAVRNPGTILTVARPSVELVQKSISSDITVSEAVTDYRAGLVLKNESAKTVTVELAALGVANAQTPGELILNTTTSDEGFSLSAEVSTASGKGISAGNTAKLPAGEGTVKFPLSYQSALFAPWSPFAINLYLRIPALGSVSVNHLIVTSTPRLSVG